MEKQDLGKMMQDSEDQFRRQFDPNSIAYHGGSKDAVPLGGERIPQSMPNTYPENYNPNEVPPQLDYGQEYKQIETTRNSLLNLKKSLAKLPAVLEAFLRHQEAFKAKGDPNNQKHIKTHEEHMKKEQQNLKVVQEELETYIPIIQNVGEQGKLAAAELKSIISDSNKKYSTKQTLTDFNFRVKKFSTQCFNDAGKLLQKMKDIKKTHAGKQIEHQAVQQASKQEPKKQSKE